MDDLSEVRVLEVDDNGDWRHVVATQLLEQSVRMVGTACDGLEAIHKALTLQPDVIIMDVSMPRLNGLAATREISRLVPMSKVLILSNLNDPALVQEAFSAGARGYVLKALAADDLLRAVETIVRGDLFIGRGVTWGESDA